MISVLYREPIPNQASKRYRTATKRKKELAMVVSNRGHSGCSFCRINDGHCIGSCPKKIPHGKHLIESEVDSLIKTLHVGSLLTRGELVEEDFIIQILVIKKSKWLLIQDHCIRSINRIDQGVGNQLLYNSVVNRSGKEMKNNVFFHSFQTKIG